VLTEDGSGPLAARPTTISFRKLMTGKVDLQSKVDCFSLSAKSLQVILDLSRRIQVALSSSARTVDTQRSSRNQLTRKNNVKLTFGNSCKVQVP